MKGHNYSYKPVKKKKKNLSVVKQLKKKQSSHHFTKKNKLNKVTRLHSVYQSKWTSKKWRLPTILTLSVLIMFILVIPTIVVLPFGSSEQEGTVVGAKEMKEETVETASSPFTVKVKRTATEKVENIPLEDYIAGVIAAEMPAEFELEALKAQALAARTYTINHLLHGEKMKNTM